MALSGSIKRPPSENESGVILRTPMIIGRVVFSMNDEKVIQGNRVNYPIFYLDFADGCGEVTAGPEPVPLSPDGDLPESAGLGALTFLPAMMSLI